MDIIFTFIVILCSRSKISRRHSDWHGVWCLLLLLYTPVLHASMSILDCPSLQGEPSFNPRWYINANIRCFQDAEHAPLGLFALAVVFCTIALIPFLMLVAVEKLKRPYWVRCLVVPLTYPFKEKYAWWSAVELSKRAVLVFFAIYFKEDVNAVTMFIAITLALNGYIKPYKNMLVNILDMVYGIDLFIMLCLRRTADLEDILQIFPEQELERNSTLDYISDVDGYTPFTILLANFYYFPLALTLAVMAAYLSWLLYSFVHTQKTEESVHTQKTEENSENLDIAEQKRQRTETIVDLKQLESMSSSSDKGAVSKRFSFKDKQFSFKVNQRFASWRLKKPSLHRHTSKASGDVELSAVSSEPNNIALLNISEL